MAVLLIVAFNSVKVESLPHLITLSLHHRMEEFIGCPLYLPPALTITPWRRCGGPNSSGQEEKVTCRLQLFNTLSSCYECVFCFGLHCRCECVGAQRDSELMQRDEAKFSRWNIYQHRPGNNFFLTFTLIHSRKGQRGDVACNRHMCIKCCLPIQQLFALSSFWNICLLRKSAIKRELAHQQ